MVAVLLLIQGPSCTKKRSAQGNVARAGDGSANAELPRLRPGRADSEEHGSERPGGGLRRRQLRMASYRCSL